MARPSGVPTSVGSAMGGGQQQGCTCGAGMKPAPTTPAGQPPVGMQPANGGMVNAYAPNSRSTFGSGSMQVSRPYAPPTLMGAPQQADFSTLFNIARERMF
jgi:hypothetical protein